MKTRFVISVAVLGLAGLAAGRLAMAYEEPKYQVVRGGEGGFEVRRYAPYLIAETTAAGDFDQASNEAFQRLAGYIFGKSQGSRKIAMTVPVEQQPKGEKTGEKIAMTVPVEQERRGDEWVMSFMVPAAYTLETVPRPLDPRVTLREVPASERAVVRFSGRADAADFEEKKRELLRRVADAGLRPEGEVNYARYNAPWTPGFLRRNEVQVVVVQQ
jgi:hypothetical protein